MMQSLIKLFMISAILVFLSSCNRSASTSEGWIHISSKNQGIPAPGPSTQQTACLIFDVDRNGKNDFIIGSRKKGPSVLWYQRTNTGWTKHIIDDALLPIEAGGAYYDIDNDGDLDIFFGSDYQSNKVWWWENPYPEFDPATPWTRREIKNSGANQHHDMVFGDFDGDGKIELVFFNQMTKKLFIADIPPDPKNHRPWLYTEIYASPVKPEGLAEADIDGDGQIDLVGGGCWFEHVRNNEFVPHVIDDEQRSSRVAVGQLKEGGRPEVVFVAGDGVGRLKWYEWTNGAWRGHDLLGFDVDHGHSLTVADINGDGKLDVFCGEMRLNGKNDDAKMWAFLGNGKGRFTKTVIAKGFGVHEAKLGDLDGDGDLDILGKPYNWDTPRLDIWLNENKSSLDSWQRHVIDSNKPWRSIFISSADMDNDSRPDIITGGWWYKNPGSCDGNWTRHSIGASFKNMAAVFDIDGDGDLDVLGTQGKGATPNDRFVWAQNNGSGKFNTYTNIARGEGDFLQGVTVARFQKGGPLEIALSWHASGKGIQKLNISNQPQLGIWSLQKISPVSQDEGLSAGDIDRDGDLDLLLGTMWLRNDRSSWSAIEIIASEEPPDRNRLVDINGDGRLDAAVGYEMNKLAWYEQGDSVTSSWVEHLISTDIVRPMSLDVADIDNDGDIDLVVGEHNLKKPEKARLYILENIDSRGYDWKKHLVYTGDEHHDGARLVDIDKDGDLDIISIGWSHNRVLLYENKAI
jgi:hypothetical protein